MSHLIIYKGYLKITSRLTIILGSVSSSFNTSQLVEMGPSAREGRSLHGGRGIHVPFDGQRRVEGMSEPPGWAATLACSLEGLRAPRRAETGSSARGGASVCLLMGNVGREAWVSPLGWVTMLAIVTFFRGNMLPRGLEPRQGQVHGETVVVLKIFIFQIL